VAGLNGGRDAGCVRIPSFGNMFMLRIICGMLGMRALFHTKCFEQEVSNNGNNDQEHDHDYGDPAGSCRAFADFVGDDE
jgi:hypothetical protein